MHITPPSLRKRCRHIAEYIGKRLDAELRVGIVGDPREPLFKPVLDDVLMRLPVRVRWAFVGVVVVLAALGLVLLIAFLKPKSLEEMDQWAGVLGVLIAYAAVAVPGIYWLVRTLFLAPHGAEQSAGEALRTRASDLSSLLAGVRGASFARVREAWAGIGVPASAVEPLEQLDLGEIGIELPSSGIVVVTGELGSGKSFWAERVHRMHITETEDDIQAPWPCFLAARDLAGLDLAAEVMKRLPPEVPERVRLFVDGCDETSRDEAARLLRDARLSLSLMKAH